MLQHRLHAAGAQQLRGVGRDIAGGDGLQVVQQVAGLHGLLLGAQTRQQIGQARLLGQVQALGHGGQAHIAVDEQDAVSRLGDGVGQVDGQGALALGPQGAGDAHHPAFPLVGQGKHQVGAQQLVGLGGGKAQALADDGLLRLRLALARVAGALMLFAHRAASFPP